MKKNKAFSMIEMLIVMLVIGILAGIAIPTLTDKIKAEKYLSVENDLKSFVSITSKIKSAGYLAPNIDFTSTSEDKIYEIEIDGYVYKYILSFKGLVLKQVPIYDPATEDVNGANGIYAGTGVIVDSQNFFEKSCYVYNSITDSQPYWTNDCTPAALNWDY